MSSKSAPQECQIRVSSKSVLPARSAIVSSKGVLQECHLSVSSQGVPQVGSLETVTIISINLCFSTYVSAFGFVGFILFFLGAVAPFQTPLWDLTGSLPRGLHGADDQRSHGDQALLGTGHLAETGR